MADDIAIKVENVGKTFKLPHEKNSSIKSAALGFYKRKKSYEKQEVLKDVSFEIKKGEFFGIVGRNGSGKSTLLKLIAGIYSPSEGSIKVNGKLTPFIELGVGFNPELTGRENVFLNGALLGFSRKNMENMYEDIVKFAELERFMDQKLKNYSSGMQVRLAFSIAIRAESDILLIDEVLAVGDESFQRKCMEYFVKLKRSKHTVVFVTHDMSQVARFCDRAIYIENGKILVDGLTSEIADLYTRKNLETSSDAVSGENQTGDNLNLEIDFAEGKRIQTGKKLHLKLRWDADERVSNVGIAIIKDTGEYVFGTNTILDSVKLDGNSIEYVVNCNLAPSKYTLAVGLFGKTDVEIVDYDPNRASFVVEPESNDTNWGGMTRLTHEWRQ